MICTVRARRTGAERPGQRLQISFFKVNCTKSFKEKGVELGIKVAPTFIFYKNGERERTITGAKLDDVKSALAELGGAA